MLKHLKLTNVGPAPQIELELGDRLNLLTGDNGLGKSFLLDVTWWALTRRWPAEVNSRLTSGRPALPNPGGEATIEFSLTGKTKQKFKYSSRFNRLDQAWIGKAGRPVNPGLVIYAQVDGSFAVWDPARNYWKKKGNVDIQERIPAYVFSPREIWDGLRLENGAVLCGGLIQDWVNWQYKKGEEFESLCKVLKALSPSSEEEMKPGELTKISLDESREIPTLKMAYGQVVPVLHASAGMKRMVALAYVLIWAWQEHQRASRFLNEPSTSQIIFVIDEIEGHLHPKWQRLIIQGLMEAIKTISGQVETQLFVTTHSPLVMASVEPFFDANQDAWFDIDLIPGTQNQTFQVQLNKREFFKLGDATNWLTSSEAFGLKSGRSLEAEKVLEEASLAMRQENMSQEQAHQIHQQLQAVLGETDPTWIRWRYIAESKGWLL